MGFKVVRFRICGEFPVSASPAGKHTAFLILLVLGSLDARVLAKGSVWSLVLVWSRSCSFVAREQALAAIEDRSGEGWRTLTAYTSWPKSARAAGLRIASGECRARSCVCEARGDGVHE